MHIAVLDENIADRKQLERLLDRESDRRISTSGNLFVDSFGAAESLFVTPKLYDFFMIDIEGPGSACVELTKRIRADGIPVPVCILRNESEFEGIEDIPENVLFLEKPVKVADLTATIDKCLQIWEEKRDEFVTPKDEELPVKKNIFRRIFEYFY